MNRFFLILFILVLSFCNTGYTQDLILDETAEYVTAGKYFKAPEANLNYNFDDTDIVEIKLSIVDRIKSDKDVYEGQPVKFRVVSDVYYKEKLIIKQNTIVPAKIEVVNSLGMNGIPASITFGDFEFDGINKHLITDTYEIRGQDRSWLVFPLKWMLTFLPPTGSLTNFIPGGHAKLKPNKIIKIYYHPNWSKY